jgi:hypothetical protein
MTWGALFVFALELPVVLLGLMVIGNGRLGKVVRLVLALVLTTLVVWKVADAVMFTALSRGFNPITDLSLITAFLNLLSGTFGVAATVLAGFVAVIVIVLVAVLLWMAGGVWGRMGVTRRGKGLIGFGLILFSGIAIAEIGHTMGRWMLPFDPVGSAFTARLAVERVELTQTTLTHLRDFRAAAATDIYADQDGLLDLIDRDVLIIYVESYGRTSFDTPLFAETHLGTLRAAQADLYAANLSVASTFITSPTRGGQSWLAHSTFANGLWIKDQPSYGAALASNRQSLFHIAQDAGFHTAAVMPQITLAWPESTTMGFDTILAAADLGYEGIPFNWVTMPDQFTFSAMDRLLPIGETTPRFVQIALGSSHAPWVPVPQLLAWEDVGNGEIYDPIVRASDTPEVVWQDYDRVRNQYMLAVDYALQTVFSYILLHAEQAPLIIVIGDHQAAGFVALDERRDVPVHVIGPQHLVDLIANEDFHAGLIPPDNTQLRRMDVMRDLFVRAYSSAHRVADQ